MHTHRPIWMAALLGLAFALPCSPAFSAPAPTPLGEEWTAQDAGPVHWFGYSLASADGWRLAGAPLENRFAHQAGAAYLLDTTVIGGVETKIVPSERIAGARFGWSLDMTEDLIVVGAPGQGSLQGEAFVFEQSAGVWTQTARLSGLPGHGGDGFGYAVAVHADRVLVGAPFDGTHGTQAGLVYAFRKGRSLWTLEEVLASPRPMSGDQFGFCLDVDEGTVAVGAWSANIQVFNEGAVFVYTANPAGGYDWQAELHSPNPRPNAMFARSVAVRGDRIAVGATEDHLSDVRSGSVHVYLRDERGWAWQDQVQAPGAEVGNAFGYAVAWLDERLLVGSPLASGSQGRSGAAYWFQPLGTHWGLANSLEAPSLLSHGDYVGVAVQPVDGLMVGAMVGAMREGTAGYQAGAVHLHAAEAFHAPLVATYCDCSAGASCGSAPTAHGCRNSTGEGSALTLHGSTSLEADEMTLMATNLPGHARVTFVVGVPNEGSFWHDGRLCVNVARGQFTTLETRRADRRGTAVSQRSLLRLMERAGLAVVAGSSWGFQAVYYDRHGPCGHRYNATQGLWVTLMP